MIDYKTFVFNQRFLIFRPSVVDFEPKTPKMTKILTSTLRIYFIFVRNDGRFRTYKKYIFLALKSLKNEVKLKLIAAKLIGDSYTLLKIINYYFESKNFKNVKMVTNFWLPVLRGKHVFFFQLTFLRKLNLIFLFFYFDFFSLFSQIILVELILIEK